MSNLNEYQKQMEKEIRLIFFNRITYIGCEVNVIVKDSHEEYNVGCTITLYSGRTNEWKDFAFSKVAQINKVYQGIQREERYFLGEIAVCLYVEKVGRNDLDIVLNIAKELKEKYPNFTIQVIPEFIDELIINMEPNDRQGWGNAWREICKKTDNLIVLKLKLDEENDTTNLRYFLPLWEHYSKSKKVFLTIECDKDFQARACQCFAWSDNKLTNRVFVKLRQGRENEKNKQNIRLNALYSNKQGYRKEDYKKQSSVILPFLKFKQGKEQIQDPNKDGNVEQLIKIYKNGIKNELDGKSSKKLLQPVIDGIEEKIKEKDCSIGADGTENKKEDCSFAKLIFWFLIYDYVKNKKISINNEENVNKWLIEETWSNSKSYAEGLLQVIENAQIHSKGKTAFFGMRKYKADPNSSMGELAKETKTRDFLWRKYQHNTEKIQNIFNNKGYSDFLEFYVLDDAIEGEKGCGIVETFNKTGNEEIKDDQKIDNIKDIFELTEDRYKDEYKILYYIKHYGMRWLKTHVDNLKGIMEIYSPVQGAKSKTDDVLFGECFYSNKFWLYVKCCGGANKK